VRVPVSIYNIPFRVVFFLTLVWFGFVADVALSQKLQEELKYEAEANAQTEATPEFLKAFQEQGLWQVRFRFFLLLLF
jgi:hypothetical protein